MNLAFLRHRYAKFIRSHGLVRHFRSRVVWDRLRGEPPAARVIPGALASRLTAASLEEAHTLLAALHSTDQGLTAAAAQRKRRRVGPNEVGRDQPIPWWTHLARCYANPFNLLLTLLAVVSYFTQDIKATIVISAMVVLSSVLRFVQESRGSRAADALKALVGNRANVLRPDGEHDVPLKDVVPGDIVVLAAGDMIPADLRLLSAKDLFVSQAAMTGESLPVEKFPAASSPKTNPLELDNLLFMGTSVVSGAGHAVVLETGPRTYFGSMAQSITADTRPPTAFELGVNGVSWLLIRFMLVMAPLVLVINGLTKGDWMEALLFSLAIAVGLTPEMLPMIVTTTLTRGAVALSRKKVIVKRLDAIQNFGAMNVLCCDKTGTLTQDRVFLERHIDVFGADSAEVLSLAYLNSYHHTGLKSTLDDAVLAHFDVHRELGVTANYAKVDEIPFDFARKRMSVVVAQRDDHHALICKGAVEEVLAVCDTVQIAGKAVALDAQSLEKIHEVANTFSEQGLRLVAVAVKEEPPVKHVYGVSDEAGLTLMGYVAFIDPPKESTAPALQALKSHGVDVKILTGDNERVTATICREVGFKQNGLLLGHDIEAMSDADLAQAAIQTNVFAKLSPAHKERIVRVLKNAGNVVGFMGDGINDAPALHAADIGISVDSAVDIAKEAADIILLEKSLLVLDEGVVEGRRTFANMVKYIKLTASSNFGNVLSVLMASAFLPFLPMLPLQLLVQNLLYDLAQTAIPFDRVDPEVLTQPRHWKTEELGRFMLWFGPVSSVFDILTFVMLWTVFGANTPEHQSLFQSGWFIEGLMSQTLIVHMIRTRKIPFLESRAGVGLILMTAVVMTVAIFLPQGPFADYFKMQPLPGMFFVFLAAILVGYVALTQALKSLYARRFGWG